MRAAARRGIETTLFAVEPDQVGAASKVQRERRGREKGRDAHSAANRRASRCGERNDCIRASFRA